jgi:hypothetical protein
MNNSNIDIQAASASSQHTANFNFDSSQFASRINKLILDKHSKTNPFFAAMWQYFLISCNYQDSEYWLSSFQNTNIFTQQHSKSVQSRSLHGGSALIETSSNASSSANNSLQHQQQTDPVAKKSRHLSGLRSKLKFKLKKLDSNSTAIVSFLRNANSNRYPTLNENLFKYLSLTTYCDYLTSGNQLVDNTTGLTMLIINNLVELFELVTSEASVLDLFGIIHRNASASSLFIHSVNSNWSTIQAKKKLYLLHSCLKTLEGVHFSVSGQLLNLLIDKYFHLPYLSLVRYADHIACQRVEMLQSLSGEELQSQLTEQNIKMLNKFFAEQFKYSYRHKRLISLLDQLKKTVYSAAAEGFESPPQSPMPNLAANMLSQIKASPSIDFFMLYTTPALAATNLDKEWFYNMVRSACSYGSASDLSDNIVNLPSSSFLKSKQCALMLSNLDYSNILSIMQDKKFRLSILKDCLLLSAHKTQLLWEKLPGVFRNQSLDQIQNDFIHPLWSASVKVFFELLADLCANKLPRAPLVTLQEISTDRERRQAGEEIYETRLDQIVSKEIDFYAMIAPITESVNAYLKSIHQYPCLRATASSLSSMLC